MLLVGSLLAALIGLSLGVLGAGGSILTVPIFVYVLGMDPKVAIAASLAVVGATSLVGTATHWNAGNVRMRVALGFGAVAMIGAWLGTRVAQHVPGPVQLTIFAGIMLASAISMFRGRKERPDAAKISPLLLGAVGLGVGLLTGLVGVGGGFLVVPALVLFAGLPMKEAVGTSLLVIAINSFTAFAGNVGHVQIPWAVLGSFTAVAAVGIVAGTRFARRISAASLRKGFAGLLVVVAAFVLYKNRGVFAPFVGGLDLHPFLLAAAGGVLIGLAATLLLLGNGRIAGISGIAGGLLTPTRGEIGWRVAFVVGLLAGGVALVALMPGAIGAPQTTKPLLVVLAGLLVGYGTRLGSGCTSGHGICGISRGAPRSITATVAFMAAGAATVFVVRHLLGGLS